MDETERIAVIGGGVVGLCVAWNLRQLGADVVVVERGRIGGETSLGNTGWIVPALSAPVAAPGSVRQGLQMLLHRDNPFRIRPRLSPALAAWLRAFMQSAKPDRFRAGADAILALNEQTLDLFDQLRDGGVRFEMHDGGIVFLCLHTATADATQQRFAKLGYAGEIERLDGEGARVLDPSIGSSVQGALHIKPERFVRPETLTAGLHEALIRHGVEVLEHSSVHELRRDGSGWLIRWPAAELRCAKVVVAAGIWSSQICRQLGLRIPMQPGKGYSLTSPGEGTPPGRALFFVEAMIGAAPYDGAVRLAGMLELAGMDPRPHARRIGLLRDAARGYLHGWDPGPSGEAWAGLRPLPPDGLPIVGAVPNQRGAFVATGHGMVGVTLAPASGALLARMIVNGDQPGELAPFDPARF